MQRFALSAILLVSSGVLLACGALAGPGEGRGADADDGGSRDGSASSSIPGTVTNGCNVRVNGVSVTDAPVVATPSAMLQGSQLLFQCSYHDDAGSYGSLTVYVDAVSGAGTYESSNAYLQEYSPGESTHGYSSSDPQSGANYPCSVVIDSFDPRDKGGMSARFSCPHLVDSFDEKSAAGSVLLLPRAGHDAGAPPDAGGLNEAGAPSCVLHAHGAYEADTVGYGDNYRCYTYASDGTSFSYSPGAAGVTTGYVGVGAAWCTTCGIDYSGGKCTLDVEVDEGIGGRFAASFTCTGLVGGDGTTESVDGRIDGTHMRPPD